MIETRVAEIDAEKFAARLESGLGLRIGPFDARLCVRGAGVAGPLRELYLDYPLLSDDAVYSFHAQLVERPSLLPWRRPRVRFSVDGRVPHEDMPAEQALAVLEWGINLVIALRSHNFLMLHAAVVELGGKSLLLPAAPGCGKTTLCAALVLRGWRLFSDEFGLLRPGDDQVTPVPRPLALKNESIDVIRNFSADAEIGPSIPNTRKGTVAHLKAPADSVRRAATTAPARLIVFPEWREGSPYELRRVSPGECFMRLATNAFNYELLGEAGFDTVRRIVDGAQGFRLIYSDLGDATERLRALIESVDG